jgi:hypothetical protein
LPNGQNITGGDVVVKFLEFLVADLASSVLGSQFLHARSILGGKTQSQDIAGELGRDALLAGLEDPAKNGGS